MEWKKVIGIAMESPLYFTMSVNMRLNYVNRRERCFSSNSLREYLLSWVRTGHFNTVRSN
jgi:hypothetical protein